MDDLIEGDNSFKRGDWIQAEAAYRRALEETPQNAYVLVQLARTLVGQGRYEEAEDFCQTAIHLDDSVAEAHITLGNIALRSKDSQAAEREFRKALELDSKNERACIGLSGLLIERQEYGKAVELLTEARKVLKDSATIAYNLGLAYLSIPKYKEASHFALKALKIDDNLVDAHVLLGLALRSTDFQAAEREFRKALELDSKNERAYVTLSALLIEHRMYREAIELLTKAIKLGLKSVEIEYNLGLSYLSLRRNEDAFKHLREALDIAPDFADAAGALGHLYMKEKNYPASRAYYERAVALKPDCFDYQFNLGWLDAREHNLKSARLRFRELSNRSGRTLSLDRSGLCFLLAPPLEERAYLFVPLALAATIFAGIRESTLVISGAGVILTWLSFYWLWYRSKGMGVFVFTTSILLVFAGLIPFMESI